MAMMSGSPVCLSCETFVLKPSPGIHFRNGCLKIHTNIPNSHCYNPVNIHENTFIQWPHALGLRKVQHKKGTYTDDHERLYIVNYRQSWGFYGKTVFFAESNWSLWKNSFLEKVDSFEGEKMDVVVHTQLYPTEKKHGSPEPTTNHALNQMMAQIWFGLNREKPTFVRKDQVSSLWFISFCAKVTVSHMEIEVTEEYL